MADLAVSIDENGNITCNNLNTNAGATVEWTPVTGGSISSIDPGNPSPFSRGPSKNESGIWWATIASFPGGSSFSYTINADTALGSRANPKTPRITIIAP